MQRSWQSGRIMATPWAYGCQIVSKLSFHLFLEISYLSAEIKLRDFPGALCLASCCNRKKKYKNDSANYEELCDFSERMKHFYCFHNSDVMTLNVFLIARCSPISLTKQDKSTLAIARKKSSSHRFQLHFMTRLFLFGDHTQRCSELTPSSVLSLYQIKLFWMWWYRQNILN